MMVDLRIVRQVLREHLLTVPAVTSANFLPEDRPRKRPIGIHVQETLQPEEKPIANKLVEAAGRVQYDVMYMADRGTEQPEALAKSIVDIFPPGTQLDSQGITIYIDKVQRSPGRQFDTAWWFVPVSILWRTYATTAS